MRISPGPPDYLYGGKLIRIPDDATLDIDLRLRHIQHDIHGDVDYGLGVRREDGWLIMRIRGVLASTGGIAPIHTLADWIAACLPVPDVTVRTLRNRPGPSGLWPIVVWAYGQDTSVNDLIGARRLILDTSGA